MLGIGSKRAAPQALAEHDHRRRAGLAVVRAQRAARKRLLAEEREELRGHDRRVHDGGLAAGRQRQLVLLSSRHLAEDAGLLAQLGEVRIGPARSRDPLLRLHLEHVEQLLRARRRAAASAGPHRRR